MNFAKQKYVYMQSNLHKIKRSQDALTSRQCTMRPSRGWLIN